MSPTRRCAIYTRKSSEEGLDQDFNSLDAQYESCEAYIYSQRSEGWNATKNRYDDGGFSGGNMDRPGLKRLLADIEKGLIDIVVVYKIDRLTRSLTDFSKLVEVFDRHGVTFVSVTQSFNTTTSMGRLTLNVLLSFAQFEREVTGERIRDKIAASKKKGMWMGGAIPVGYVLQDRQLVPDLESKPLVEHIFARYLYLGSVGKLQMELLRDGIRTRSWRSRKGTEHGQALFSHGLLCSILRNVIYIGQIRHRDKIYDGQHEGIIDREVWERVQAKLIEQSATRRRAKKFSTIDILKGKVFDTKGIPYSPTQSNKEGRRYRYYVSQRIIQNPGTVSEIMERLPGPELEAAVTKSLEQLVDDKMIAEIINSDDHHFYIERLKEGIKHINLADFIPMAVKKVTVKTGEIEIMIDLAEWHQLMTTKLSLGFPKPMKDTYVLTMPFITGRLKTSASIHSPSGKDRLDYDPFDISETELQKWVQGIIWRDEHFRGTPIMTIAEREDVSHTHVLKVINGTFCM